MTTAQGMIPGAIAAIEDVLVKHGGIGNQRWRRRSRWYHLRHCAVHLLWYALRRRKEDLEHGLTRLAMAAQMESEAKRANNKAASGKLVKLRGG